MSRRTSIEALRQWVQALGATEDEWTDLANDPRPQVQRIAAEVERARARIEREWQRLQDMAHEETLVRDEGYHWVAGVDEAGRGPLAGPVVAAAVIFPPNVWVPGVRDSKQLGPEARRQLAALIRQRAAAVGVGVVDSHTIDRINILQASLQAMQEAVAHLPIPPDYCLIDGSCAPQLACPSHCIIAGDARCFSVAAASIVAKVYRDEMMEEFDRQYPGYGFAENKGYPTTAHRQALAELGPCPIHRYSFRGVKEAGATAATAATMVGAVAEERTRPGA